MAEKSLDKLQIKDVVLNLGDFQESLEAFAQLYAFSGYDPVKTFEILKANAKKANRNAKQFTDDMFEIIAWFVLRGAKYTDASRSAARTKQEGKDRIRKLMAIYNVLDQTPKKAEDINIARVIGVFAFQTASVIAANPDKVRKIVDPSKYNLPVWCCFPQAASLITDDMLQSFIDWSCELDQIINRGKVTTAGAPYVSDKGVVSGYVKITFNSTLYPMSTRAANVKRLNEISK